jgi:DNA polymerase III subunit delta'
VSETQALESVVRATPYPWQQEHWDRLEKLVRQDTLPHALLLVGQRGMGQRDFAEAFATLLLCEKLGHQACGTCSSCALMYAETHPDFFALQPEDPGGIIKIDQVRDLINSLAQRSLKGRYKVILIEPLESLNVASSNALLKQLEEPFPKTIFILISYDVSRLLPSVVSRCQRLRFYTDLTPALERWLKSRLTQSGPDLVTLWKNYPAPFQLLEAMIGLSSGSNF